MKKNLFLLLLACFLSQTFSQILTPNSPNYDENKKNGVLIKTLKEFYNTQPSFRREIINQPINYQMLEPKSGEWWEEGFYNWETGKFEKTAGTCFQSMAGSTQATGAVGCDDCSHGSVPLGFTFNVCGNPYTSLYINSNGNVTFGGPYYTYTAIGMPNSTTDVMIAPFWGDVDTRGCGDIRYKSVGGTRFMVYWDAVGYYSYWCDKLNTFQLILTNGSDPVLAVGNNVAFDYGDMQWTTGDASFGVGGFGGDPACVGINANDGINAVVVGYFDNNSASYDGPAGANDGVNYLDNKCFQFNVATGCAPLPVVLTRLYGYYSNHNVNIEWITSSENENKEFEIQRSENSTDFFTIGIVSSHFVSGSANYSFIDRDTELGKKYFYRLKQISNNGEYTISNIIEINTDNVDMEISPNPVVEYLNISFSNFSQEENKVEIFCIDGRCIYSEILNINQNNFYKLDVSELSSGVYFVKNNFTIKKFVKL